MKSEQSYKKPRRGLNVFHCPNCNVCAKQTWEIINVNEYNECILDNNKKLRLIDKKTRLRLPLTGLKTAEEVLSNMAIELGLVRLAICDSCEACSLWLGNVMIYPDHGITSSPNADLNSDIQQDYWEAASILHKSPRGAAALLRLCIQKLCIQLGLNGKDLNEDIAELVKMGLAPKIQRALDSVRVFGNEAVHPGVLDLEDDVDTVEILFGLVNEIANELITREKIAAGIYEMLPQNKRDEITKRDKKNAK